LSTDGGLHASLGQLSATVERLTARFGRIVPPHAFVLTRDRLVHVAMEKTPPVPSSPLGGLKVRSVVLPPGAFREGPGGVGVAGPGLADALGQLIGKDGKSEPTAASLSVPDAFVRVVAVDVEPGSERNAKEVEEVLQWKLGRTFGEAPPPLRISWQAAGPAPGGGTRILGLGTPEEAAASWEGVFAGRGIRIGVIVPEVLAVAPIARKALGGSGLFVWAHGGTLSTAAYEGGALRFLRSKPEDADPSEAVQEIRLFASFAATAVAGATVAAGAEGALEGGAATAGPEASDVVRRFAEFRKESGWSDLIPLRGGLAARGLQTGFADPAVLAGVGLMTGEE
jgi:hypothetical protein